MSKQKKTTVAKLATVVLCCLVLVGCSYCKDRSHDFKDMFTVSVEEGSYVVALQVLPLQLGYGAGSGRGWGLRSGVAGKYSYNEGNIAFFGNKSFMPDEDPRRKGYTVAWEWIPMPFFLDGIAGPSRVRGQVEVVAGLAVCVRLGLNVFEMLDFFSGIVAYDPLSDDGKSIAAIEAAEAEAAEKARKGIE